MTSLKLLLATRNEHKRREFERLLARSDDGAPSAGRWQLDSLPAEVTLPPEEGETFAENALSKARAASRATGRVSIADDSGIAAAALGGAPGVRSARYAGEQATDAQNLHKLMREAHAGSPREYVCVIAYVDPHTQVERLFEGRCTGTLAAQARGEGGFGYDPAFVPDEVPPGRSRSDGQAQVPTMAELSDEQKDAISHRGRAARALAQWLESSAAQSATAG